MRKAGSLTICTDGFTARAGFGKICALRAPTVFSARMKSVSAQKTRLWIKARAIVGGFYTRSSIARGCAFHPCAIDDPRGRIYRPCRFWQDLRAARANRVSRADEKRIRTENTVLDKNKGGLG